MMNRGADRHHLKAKIFGGNHVGDNSFADIGANNLQFATKFLETEGIPIVACFTDQGVGMHVKFHTHSNKAVAQLLDTKTISEKGSDPLELGAADFVTKPKLDVTAGMDALSTEIIEKVKAAAQARIQRRSARSLGQSYAKSDAVVEKAKLKSTHKVIAIGASTGGVEAVLDVLTQFPPDAPGTVVVIHMPEGFTRSFAARLDRQCKVHVKEAEDGDRILPGHVLLAAGNQHLAVDRSGATTSVRVFAAPPVCGHRPSVDVLFQSCAKTLGRNAVGAILTGMGSDGAKGLWEMRGAGAFTIAQDENSCVVFGMPREAISLGEVDETLPLKKIPSALLEAAKCETLIN